MRRRTYGAVAVCIGLGFLRDMSADVRFPSALTLAGTVLVVLGLELHAYLRGTRSLSITPNGITLEQSFGGTVIRLAWSELQQVEVRRPLSGAVWVFLTKNGKRITWVQAGFEGDQRLELERVLVGALREHRVRLEGRFSTT